MGSDKTWLIIAVYTIVTFVPNRLILADSNQTREAERRYEEFENQVDYLVKYGYLSQVSSRSAVPHSASGHSPIMTAAIRAFQRMALLPETGVMDEKTVRMMAMPRCGNKDMPAKKAPRRQKRYDIQGSKWDKKHITWSIGRYTDDLDRNTVIGEFHKAFDIWQEVTPIVFEYVPESPAVDILAGFVTKVHGDGHPFDGEGGTLAHAFFPTYGGDVHLDDDELWITGPTNEGFNLLTVAAHEVGHSLGLDHSEDPNSLMNAYYGNFESEASLRPDDINGIQRIYGTNDEGKGKTDAGPALGTRRSTTPPNPRSSAGMSPHSFTPNHRTTTGHHSSAASNGRTTPPHNPSRCHKNCAHSQIDAMVTVRNQIFTFQDKTLMVMDGYGTIKEVTCITDVFRGVPLPVDAAEVINGELYIFKGDNVWRYDLDLQPGPVSKISAMFPGVPPDVDAVFKQDVTTYIIKGSAFYKLTGIKGSLALKQDMASWNLHGCPRVSTAMTWSYNERLYFFCGDRYFRYHRWLKAVDTDATPPYPREISHWWLGCSSPSRLVENPGTGRALEYFDFTAKKAPVSAGRSIHLKLHLFVLLLVSLIALRSTH